MDPLKIALFAALAFGSSSAAAASLDSYHIGNSLTWDARVLDGFPAMAASAGHFVTTGYHIRCSNSLEYIAANPSDTCVEPNEFGTWNDAVLNNGWGGITLQPHAGTAWDEMLAAKLLISVSKANPANANTVFYTYAAWPQRPNINDTFENVWLNTPLNDPTDPYFRVKSHVEWIHQRLLDDPQLQGVPQYMIPVGEVMSALDVKMRNGQVPGIVSARHLYRDINHLNNVGRFAAAGTLLATMLGTDPTGLPVGSYFLPGIFDFQQITITPEMATVIQETIWEVVRAHPYALPPPLFGDANNDRAVTANDILAAQQAFGSVVIADGYSFGDADDNGVITVNDILTVQTNFGATATSPAGPAAPAVPEPAAGLLLLAPLALRRREKSEASRKSRAA